MSWQLWIKVGLIIVAGIGLLPNYSVHPKPWQAPMVAAIPTSPDFKYEWITATAATAATAATTITSEQQSTLNTTNPFKTTNPLTTTTPRSILLSLGEVNNRAAAELWIQQLYSNNLRAYFTKGGPPLENTFRIWVGPYWSTTEAQADMRSFPILLASGQLVEFIN